LFLEQFVIYAEINVYILYEYKAFFLQAEHILILSKVKIMEITTKLMNQNRLLYENARDSGIQIKKRFFLFAIL
jgi:hypothetical protein